MHLLDGHGKIDQEIYYTYFKFYFLFSRAALPDLKLKIILIYLTFGFGTAPQLSRRLTMD